MYLITKLQLRFFFSIFLKSSYQVNLSPSPHPIVIYCLQNECCQDTACSKKAAFFKYLCIRQKLRLMNVLIDRVRAKYYTRIEFFAA